MARSPLVLAAAAAYCLFFGMSDANIPKYGSGGGEDGHPHHQHGHIKYTTITGFFKQDDPTTNGSTFNYTTEDLGLIKREYDTDKSFDPHHRKSQWQRFEAYVEFLNRHAKHNVDYKVLYMGRHGEGYHNTAESYYGTPAWDCYWSEKDGNATTSWADAKLTPNGLQQAQIANRFWADKIKTEHIPVPQSYYTSPLSRCLATAYTTFTGLDLPHAHPFKPTVKELLREAIGIHTCDRRSSRTDIHTHYPAFPIERGFTEHDELWRPDLRETSSAQVARLMRLLDDVFIHDRHTFISFTSHSGSIGSILAAIGHQPFSLVTGAVIPVLVKAESVAAPAPSTSIAASTRAPTCTANPSVLPTPTS